jgi:hypothetical protein
LKFVIRPVAGSCGYEPIRADEIDEPGVVTSQIVQRIVSSPILVADLTDGNPNVFYELALRHATRKPAIHLIDSRQRPPFDLGGNRTILVDHRDLSSVEAAKGQLERQIIAAENDPAAVDNPISVSVELQALRTSGNPLVESIGRTESMVHDLVSISATRELSAVAGPFSHAFSAAQEIRDQLASFALNGDTIPAPTAKELYERLVSDVVTPLGMMRRHYGLSRFDPGNEPPAAAPGPTEERQ